MLAISMYAHLIGFERRCLARFPSEVFCARTKTRRIESLNRNAGYIVKCPPVTFSLLPYADKQCEPFRGLIVHDRMVVCRCILAQQGWHSALIRSLENMEERGPCTGFAPELHEVFLNAMLCRLAFFELNVHLCCTRLNDKVNIGSVGYCATYCILPLSRDFYAEVDVRPLQNARENLSRFWLPDQRSISP